LKETARKMEFGHSQVQRIVGPCLAYSPSVTKLFLFRRSEDIDFHRGLAVDPTTRISIQVSCLDIHTDSSN
jgi:hypothetical protein